jgi:hypothetical protein
VEGEDGVERAGVRQWSVGRESIALVQEILPIVERVHPYQRERTSITGLRLKLSENIETGRLVGVVTARLVLLLFYRLCE